MSTSTPSLKTDLLLTPFTTPTFSPTTYLNNTLPSLPPPTTTTKPPLPSLATSPPQTQSQISTLSAQTARLSTTLTALTDDILRCSSRLAYEVELLRGEALGLVESLELENAGEGDESLAKAMRALMPASSDISEQEGVLRSKTPISAERSGGEAENEGKGEEEKGGEGITPQKALEQLHTLLHVRTLLTSTTQTFNAALSFPLPPSLLSSPSATSALISIAPPSPPPSQNHKSTSHRKKDEEERAQSALHTLHQELEALAAGEDGEARAREKISELREVVRVWKGTGEEKARGRVVDALEGGVEEVVRKQGQGQGQGRGRERRRAVQETRAAGGGEGGGAGRGFLEGLQRLRGEMGMD